MMVKRAATGVVAVAALVGTAIGVGGSAPANADLGPKPPLRSTAPVAPRPFISIGTGPAIDILVTAAGQALYYNDQDTVAATACAGACAVVWRPLLAPGSAPMSAGPGLAGQLSTMKRADGSTQVTYNGRALYTYTVDAVGHVTGDRIIDTFVGRAYSWHAATATGQPLPSALPVPPSPGASGPPLPGVSPGPSGLPLPSPSLSGPGFPTPSGSASPSGAPIRPVR